MKLRFVLAIALAVAIAAPSANAQVAQKSGRTVGEMLDKLKRTQASARPADRVRPDVIYLNVALPAFMFPAGNVPAGNQTHFKSDVTLANFGTSPQLVEVAFLRQAENNCAAGTMLVTLQPGFQHFDDFVGSTLGQTGLGTLVFAALDSSGEDVDLEAMIDGFSRIWTPLPGSAGTTSQQFTAVALDDLFLPEPGYAIGLRQDAGFRTNAGITNLDQEERRFTLEVHTNGVPRPGDTPITVPPCSMRQTNIPPGNHGTIMLRWVPLDPTELWSAYGSSTDNITGDGWVVQANHGPHFDLEAVVPVRQPHRHGHSM